VPRPRVMALRVRVVEGGGRVVLPVGGVSVWVGSGRGVVGRGWRG